MQLSFGTLYEDIDLKRISRLLDRGTDTRLPVGGGI